MTSLLTTIGSTSTINGSLTVTDNLTIKKFAILSNNTLEYEPSYLPGVNVACSSNGQYVIFCAFEKVFVSSNSGLTFTQQNFTGYNIVAVCVSSTGQYMSYVTSGIPDVDTRISTSINFGVSFVNNVIINISNSTDYYTNCSMSPNGQQIFTSGIKMESFTSIDAGATATSNLTISSNRASAMKSGGSTMVCGSNGLVSNVDCSVLSASNNLVPYFTIAGTLGQVGIAWAPDGLSFVHVGSAGFSRSTSLVAAGATYTVVPTPESCFGVVHCGNIVYVRSAANVYTTTDLGATWVLFYSGTPRSIAASVDGSIIYILNQNGDLVSRRSSGLTRFAIGSTMQVLSTALTAFTTTSTVRTGTSLIDIPPGVWSISFGWTFSASSTVGNGSDNNVLYGLSYTATGFEIISINTRYSITYPDTTTYESFADNVILTLLTKKTLFLNAQINKLPATTTTGAQITNCFIRATLLNDISIV